MSGNIYAASVAAVDLFFCPENCFPCGIFKCSLLDAVLFGAKAFLRFKDTNLKDQ